MNFQIFTSKLLMLLNIGVFGLILLLTQLLAKGPRRVLVLGWVCVAFSVSVFAAPLSIIVRIKTYNFSFLLSVINTYNLWQLIDTYNLWWLVFFNPPMHLYFIALAKNLALGNFSSQVKLGDDHGPGHPDPNVRHPHGG